MSECFAWQQDMNEVDGCVSDRKIVIDGEVFDPIRFGDATSDRSYEKVIEDYERQIENGGRGNLSVETTRKELERFKNRYTKEEYENRKCHDCGVEVGEIHHPGCDMEECPNCGGQYFICDCVTHEKQEMWGEL